MMMRKKENTIDFGEFSVPTVSESEIRDACEKIAAHMPKETQAARVGFPIYRYGLIAACLVLVVVTAVSVPKWSVFNNTSQVTIEGGRPVERQDNQKIPSNTIIPPDSAAKNDKPKTKVNNKPDGAAKPKVQTEKKTASAPLDTDTDIKNETKKAVPAAAVAPKPVEKPKNKTVAAAEPESPVAEDAMRQDTVIAQGGDTMTGSAPTEALMQSGTMSSQAVEPTRIITVLTAGKNEDTVLLSNGKLTFEETAGGAMLKSALSQPQAELWSDDKVISFFGGDARPTWIPGDLSLTQNAESNAVNVRDDGTQLMYLYDNGASRSLTVSVEKPNEPNKLDAANSAINGNEIFASYQKSGEGAADYGKYSAKFDLNGLNYVVTSVNLTQEEFVKVIVSYFG